MKRLFFLALSLSIISSCGTKKASNQHTSEEQDTREKPENRNRERAAPSPSSPEQNNNQRATSELLEIEAPLPKQNISSPLEIKGKARGQWYFEGNFPVVLEDSKGNILARGAAEAQGQWMTSDFVPFELTLTYRNAPSNEVGHLVFQRANASGKSENDQSLRLPVSFPPR